MRGILFLIIMPIYFIIGLPYLCIVLFIGLFNHKRQVEMAYQYNRLTSWLTYKIAGAKFVIEGKENLHHNTNVLYVSNHRSMLDIPLLMIQSKEPILFIGKDSIKKWPFVGWWLVAMDGLLLNRTNPREGLKTILLAIERIKAGASCVIYPEGTRSKDEALLPFKQGSFKLASKTGVPIIPMSVLGTEDVLENNGLNLKPKTVYLTIGKPILLSDLSNEDQLRSAAYIQGIIEAMYADQKNRRKSDQL